MPIGCIKVWSEILPMRQHFLMRSMACTLVFLKYISSGQTSGKYDVQSRENNSRQEGISTVSNKNTSTDSQQPPNPPTDVITVAPEPTGFSEQLGKPDDNNNQEQPDGVKEDGSDEVDCGNPQCPSSADNNNSSGGCSCTVGFCTGCDCSGNTVDTDVQKTGVPEEHKSFLSSAASTVVSWFTK